jgi:hypothetical protein
MKKKIKNNIKIFGMSYNEISAIADELSQQAKNTNNKNREFPWKNLIESFRNGRKSIYGETK